MKKVCTLNRNKLASLSQEENKSWVTSFEYYANVGQSDSQADKHAWEDLQKEFPRLKKFTGVFSKGGDLKFDVYLFSSNKETTSSLRRIIGYCITIAQKSGSIDKKLIEEGDYWAYHSFDIALRTALEELKAVNTNIPKGVSIGYEPAGSNFTNRGAARGRVRASYSIYNIYKSFDLESLLGDKLYEGGSPYDKGTGWYEDSIEKIDEDDILYTLKYKYGYGDVSNQLQYFRESSFYNNPIDSDEFAEQMDEYLKSDENNENYAGGGLIELQINTLKKMDKKNPSDLLKMQIKVLEKMAKKEKKGKYKLGDKYSEDFDYTGMLEYGLSIDIKSKIEILEALSDSFEDVNYHDINKPLQQAISFLNHGETEKAKQYLIQFKDACRKGLGIATVYIDKKGNKFVVKDFATKENWANEYFDTIEEAYAFIAQNNLHIVVTGGSDAKWIESKEYPGQFTDGKDDGEKPMFTIDEIDLLESGYKIENEYRASRKSQGEVEGYMEDGNKLTYSNNEFGGSWRIWVTNEAEPKPEPAPKHKVGDILMHQDSGKSYKVKILAVTGWTGDGHRYDIEFLDENDKGKGTFAKSYDELLSEPSPEPETEAEKLTQIMIGKINSPVNVGITSNDNHTVRLAWPELSVSVVIDDSDSPIAPGILLKYENVERNYTLKNIKDAIRDINEMIEKPGGEEKPKPSGEIFANPERFIKYGGEFLYPPRAEEKIRPTAIMFKRVDNGTYIAQPKLNGSATSVTIFEDSFIAKERHNTFFSVPPTFDLQSLHRGKGAMCLTGEFMNKSKKDEDGEPLRGFCIWDITAYEGNILVGSTIEERIKLLEQLYPSAGVIKTKEGTDLLYKTDVPDVYRVANFDSGFEKLFNEISKIDLVEGFVLKRKSGRLEMMTKEVQNGGWQIKARKPTANYEHFEGGAIGNEDYVYKDFYRGQGGITFKTEEEVKNFIRGKVFVRKQLKEGNFVVAFNGEDYYIAEKVQYNSNYEHFEGGSIATDDDDENIPEADLLYYQGSSVYGYFDKKTKTAYIAMEENAFARTGGWSVWIGDYSKDEAGFRNVIRPYEQKESYSTEEDTLEAAYKSMVDDTHSS